MANLARAAACNDSNSGASLFSRMKDSSTISRSTIRVACAYVTRRRRERESGTHTRSFTLHVHAHLMGHNKREGKEGRQQVESAERSGRGGKRMRRGEANRRGVHQITGETKRAREDVRFTHQTLLIIVTHRHH